MQSDTGIFRCKSSPFTSLDNSEGLDKYSFNFVKALSHLSVKSRPLLFFIAEKKGLHLSRDRERNRLRAAALPVKLCISFTILGDYISMIAVI